MAQLERDQEARRTARESARPGQATIAFERGAGALLLLLQLVTAGCHVGLLTALI